MASSSAFSTRPGLRTTCHRESGSLTGFRASWRPDRKAAAISVSSMREATENSLHCQVFEVPGDGANSPRCPPPWKAASADSAVFLRRSKGIRWSSRRNSAGDGKGVRSNGDSNGDRTPLPSAHDCPGRLPRIRRTAPGRSPCVMPSGVPMAGLNPSPGEFEIRSRSGKTALSRHPAAPARRVRCEPSAL